MSSKKKPAKPAPTGGRVIDFDALLGNYPTIRMGGIQFVGRHVNQTEKAQWREAALADDVAGQKRFLVAALNARGADVDEAWVEQWPDAFLVAIVDGLHGLGWPGEEGAEGK